MEGLEASLINAKILTLMHDALQQPITTALQKRLRRGRGAVYCGVPLASSVLLQSGEKSRPNTSPAQRSLHEAGSGPRRQVTVAGNGFGLKRRHTTYLAFVERYDTEWHT